MKTVSTIYSNYKLVLDEYEIPVAVQIDGEIKFRLYDNVIVNDSCGYIGPGITKTGAGTIIRIRPDSTDYFFEILMLSGERGFVKAERLSKVCL